MATANRPNRITLDAYSDPNLEIAGLNGVYSQFTNQLQTPILGAKSFELISATFINDCLQLNDQSQLMFFYYRNASASNIRGSANIRCVRLHPSTFVPYTGFTSFVKNKYFNSVTELCAALTAASAAGGDDTTYNPNWVSGDLTFSYDTTTRKISVTAANSSIYIAPAAFDDPFIPQLLQGQSPFTPAANYQIKMNAYNSSNTNATATIQPYVLNQTMNPRLGFAMSINSNPIWRGVNTQYGVATSTGVPMLTGTLIEADSNPILLGAQSVGIYLDTVVGGGYDSANAKNLLSPVFINVPPLNVVSYVPASVNQPLLSIAQEIYQITVRLVDDAGVPFVQSPNFNVRIEISIGY